MKHYGFGSRILAWVCVVVMLVMMMPLSGFTAVEEEIVEESPVFEAPVVLAALDGEGEEVTTTYDISVGAIDNNKGSVTVTVNGVEAAAAAEGDAVSIQVAMKGGYKLESISAQTAGATVDLTENGDTYSFTMPAAEVSVAVSMVAKSLSINTSAEHGTITLSEPRAEADDSISFTVVADAGYALVEGSVAVTSGGIPVNVSENAGTYSFTMPSGDVWVAAQFEAQPFSISVTESEDYKVEVAAEAKTDEEVTFTVEVIKEGHEVSEVTVNGDVVAAGEDGSYSFTMPAEKVTITATLSAKSYAVTVNTENVTASELTSGIYGNNVSLTVEAKAGYQNVTVMAIDAAGNTVEVTPGENNSYSFTMPASAVSVYAEAKAKDHEVKVADIANGSVTVSSPFANVGEDITITVMPDDHYELSEVMVNGAPITAGENDYIYTLPENMAENEEVIVSATFTAIKYTITLNLQSMYISKIEVDGNSELTTGFNNEENTTETTGTDFWGREYTQTSYGYVSTFDATVEHSYKVYFEKKNDTRETGQKVYTINVSWPEDLFLGDQNVNSIAGYEYSQKGSEYILTIDQGAVTAPMTLGSSSVMRTVTVSFEETYGYTITMKDWDVNAEGVQAKQSVDYEIDITVANGYSLPEAAAGIEVAVGGEKIEASTTDSDTGTTTQNYTWENNVLTLKAVSLQDDVVVSMNPSLDNDNYIIEGKTDTEDEDGNAVLNWNDSAVIITPDGPATGIVYDSGIYDGIIVGKYDGDGEEYPKGKIIEEDGKTYYYTGTDCKNETFEFALANKFINSVPTSVTLSVDTTDPELAVDFDEEDAKAYVNTSKTVTFTVTEDNFDPEEDDWAVSIYKVGAERPTDEQNTSIDGYISWSEDGTICSVTLTCADATETGTGKFADGEYEVTLGIFDDAGHFKSVPSGIIVLDQTAPVVEVTKYVDADDTPVATYGETGNRYVNNSIDITFRVTETNFDKDRFTFTGLPESGVTIDEWSSTGNVHEITVTLTADQVNDGVYDAIKLAGTDMASNSGEVTAEPIVLDKTLPVVAVTGYEIGTEQGQLYNGTRYVSGTVKITFQVTERNFDAVLFENGFTGIPSTGFSKTAWSSTDDKHTITVTLTADQNDGVYDAIKLAGTDMAGNGGEIKAEPIVLDKKDPVISKITYVPGDNMADKGNNWLEDLWYWIFGGDNVEDGYEGMVTGSFTVTDELSPIDSSTILITEEDDTVINWEYEASADEKTYTVKFVCSAQYKEELSINASDMAQNEAEELTYVDVNDNNTNLLLDTTKPVISFVNPDYTTVNSNDYTVKVSVEDPNENTYSGLASIVCVANYTSDGEKKTYSDAGWTWNADRENGEYIQAKNMELTLPASLHSNTVVITVTAVDNAGNEFVLKSGNFKMDNTAPVVDVNFDNNNAENSTYFDDTRTATITLVDINFNEDASIKTEGSVGEWDRVSGAADLDSDGLTDTWECKVYYGPDDDYTLSMSAWDTASPNANTTEDSAVTYTGTAPQDFTVDRTAPTFEITMGNADVDVSSGGYSNQDVTVTLTVDEHNFDADAATAGLTVIYEGKDISQYIRNSLVWSSNGDVRTATFTLTDDGEYKINLSFLDLAGNSTAAAEDIVVHVDQADAAVYVTGVADKSANAQDEIIPVVTIWDKYYNLEGVVITLINGEGKDVTEQYLDMETGLSEILYNEEKDLYYQTFTFKNLDEDHVYHLEVRHTDLAGNVNTVMTVLNGKGEEEVLDLEEGVMRFSVNRNGSTYSASEETLAILGQYVQSAKNVRILEINVDELDPESIYITLTHDNVTRDLVYGEDYTYQTPPEQNDASWNVYEYVLEDSLFEEDGVYTITIYSVDAAGNVAQNNTEEKDFEITFVVDKTPPIFVALNLEAGEIYNEEQHEVTINCSDNIALDTVHVYRLDSTAEKDEDGNYIWFREKANGEIEMLCEEVELTAVEGSNGDYSFVLYEGENAATSKQSVLVVCTDKAGNQNLEQEILDFTVSSSFWILFLANKPLFYGSIGGISALLIVAAIVFLRKKKEDEET